MLLVLHKLKIENNINIIKNTRKKELRTENIFSETSNHAILFAQAMIWLYTANEQENLGNQLRKTK